MPEMELNKKIEDLTKMLDNVKKKYQKSQTENTNLRSKVVELADSNMGFYGRAENTKLIFSLISDYQKLIFRYVLIPNNRQNHL